MTIRAHLKSAGSLSVITLNLSFWTLPLVLAALVKLVFPSARGPADRVMEWIYRAAVVVDDFWLGRVIGLRWERPDVELRPDETLIVLSNHSSWSDILLLQSLLAREGPVLKFLVKRELIWVPLLGLIIWAFDFPILRRRARSGGSDLLRQRQDIEALARACDAMRGRPIALMNFAEGTRFEPTKRAAATSPFDHLLRPRVGGLSAMLEALGDQLDGIIDVTLVYDPPVSFWQFLSGEITRVEVEAERIAPAEVPRTRRELEAWLGDRWQKKEARITAALAGRQGEPPDRGRPEGIE